MIKRFITKEPIIISIDSGIKDSTSSMGRYAVDYSIKWNLSDKNPIKTMIFFWKLNDAYIWIQDTMQELKKLQKNKTIKNLYTY